MKERVEVKIFDYFFLKSIGRWIFF